MCRELLYSVALWLGDQAALYRAITAHRAAAKHACISCVAHIYIVSILTGRLFIILNTDVVFKIPDKPFLLLL